MAQIMNTKQQIKAHIKKRYIEIRNQINRMYHVRKMKFMHKEKFYEEKEAYLYDSRTPEFYFDRPNLIKIIDYCFMMHEAFQTRASKLKSVLDIGCNMGHIMNIFSTKYRNYKFVGIDINEMAIENANKLKKNQNEVYIKGNILEFNEYDEEFDIVICFDVLEHMCKCDNNVFFSKINSVLKEDGLVCIETPNGHASDDGFHHMQFFSIDSLERLLKSYFKIIYIGKSGFNPLLNKEHDILFAIVCKTR